MKLAHHRQLDGPRLLAHSDGGWADVATATGDARLATLGGLLAAGPQTLATIGDVLIDAPKLEAPAFGPLLDTSSRVFCVGRNYVEHRDEFDNDPTPWPEVFLRFGTSIAGPFDDVPRPSVTESLDYEGELGVIIGRAGRHIAGVDALDHVFGYTVANDVSVRDWQSRGRQWTSGKNFDGTLPVGPCVVTAAELDATDLSLETRVNGKIVQSARTTQMIFDVPTQIEFLSSWTELLPGDLIVTGTPGGVGVARTPPLLLVDGDIVEVEIGGIGTIRNRIVNDGLVPATHRWRDVANG